MPTLNPNLSTVIVCPVVRLDQARHKDKSVSFLIALLVHVAVFILGSVLFVHQPQFAVEQGESSIEVDLLAAEAQPAIVMEAEIPPTKDEPEIIDKELPPKIIPPQEQRPKPEEESKGQDQQTLRSTGGAVTHAQPDYLKNPAPLYPESARRKHQQGTVLLNVAVDRFGKPTEVAIKKSSGIKVLDLAAEKVIWKWKFKPAYAGALAVESKVDVPIKFVLEEN